MSTQSATSAQPTARPALNASGLVKVTVVDMHGVTHHAQVTPGAARELAEQLLNAAFAVDGVA